MMIQKQTKNEQKHSYIDEKLHFTCSIYIVASAFQFALCTQTFSNCVSDGVFSYGLVVALYQL